MKNLIILLAALASISLLRADEKPLKDVKDMICPVKATEGCDGGYCSRKVKRDIFVEYEGRKVYFCCKGCVKAFSKDPKTFLKKAQEQWQVIDNK